jgi:hypothetical protein
MSLSMPVLKKAGRGILVLSLVLVGGSVAFYQAHAATKPTIGSVTVKTKNSVTLPISDNDFKNKKVKVTVETTNKSSNKISTTTKSLTLDTNGKDTVKIGSLHSNTKYSFRVKIKEDKSGSSYSSYSKSKSVTTSK